MAIKRFIKKPSVPSLTGWPDWAHGVMSPIKQTLEIITGRRGEKLEQLSGPVELDAVAEKVNEVIRVLQDGQDVDVQGAALPPAQPQVTVNNISQTVIQELGSPTDLGWRKNMIINPAFRFWTYLRPANSGNLSNWREGIDKADTTGDSTTFGGISDLWFIRQSSNSTGTRFTYLRDLVSSHSPPANMPTVRYCFRVLTNATTGNPASKKRITAGLAYHRYAQIAGKPTALSFWIRSSLTGVITVAFCLSVGQWWCRKSITINAANTWEKKVVFFEAAPIISVTALYTDGSIPGGSGNGVSGARIEWWLCSDTTDAGAGTAVAGYPGWTSENLQAAPGQINFTSMSTSSPGLFLTACQLEIGTEATEFTEPPDDEELLRIQHFVEKSCDIDTYITAGSTTYAGATQVGHLYASPGTYSEMWQVQFRVPKARAMKYGYEWANPGGWAVLSRTKIRNGIQPSRSLGLTFSGQASSAVGGAVLLQQEIGASGTVTSATSTTLTDNTKSWPTDHLRNLQVTITGGTGSGQTRTISSHTGTTMTLSSAWTTTPDTTSTYVVADDSRTALHWIAGTYIY